MYHFSLVAVKVFFLIFSFQPYNCDISGFTFLWDYCLGVCWTFESVDLCPLPGLGNCQLLFLHLFFHTVHFLLSKISVTWILDPLVLPYRFLRFCHPPAPSIISFCLLFRLGDFCCSTFRFSDSVLSILLWTYPVDFFSFIFIFQF